MSRRRAAVLLGLLAVAAPLLACAGGGQLSTGTEARWACPSPTPRPWGEAGPIKTTRTYSEGGQLITEPVYWQQWEQEYPTPGLSVYPSPTPYGFTGDTFTFGQRVEVAPLHAQVEASAGPRAALNVPDADQLQLYRITLRWYNPTGAPVPIDYSTQLELRALTQPGGGQRADGWRVTSQALEQAGGGTMPRVIPAGESQTTIPILAPPGTPKTVALTLPIGSAPGQATPTPDATPTPNTELRRPAQQTLTVQWTDSRLSYFGAPPCTDPGALTSWGSGTTAAEPVAAPAGASQLVAIALAQVGRPYIWGAKGPTSFDCSGLATWAYAQIGIRIPHGTSGQWPGMTPVGREAVQPGDLIYFDLAGTGRIDHVGMLVGDLNGDGRW
ncbi:MAG TPA: NlpC/P60 family protein, partial [Roseiflexaceae bacterium]|nr:NlpC/P60 family protein [Roseiflexaceae bacterium]